MTEGTASDRQQRLLRIIAETAVRPSFLRCSKHDNEFFDAFYANLADHIPGVGAMFAETDMQKQNELVRDGIRSLIDYAAGDPDVARELEHLGKLHSQRHLGIQPSMYSGWVDALVQTVEEHDPQISDDLEAAWREVLSPGIDLMISFY